MLTDEQLKSYDENGYVILPALFNSKEVNTLADITNSLAKQLSNIALDSNEDTTFKDLRGAQAVLARHPNNPDQPAIKRLVWAAAAAPELLNFGRDERILKLVAQLFASSEADHLINQVHYKYPGDGVFFGWHQDEANRRKFDKEWQDCGPRGSFVQIITSIDPCVTDNGPLIVIPGSHKWGNLNLSGYNAERLQQEHLDPRGLALADIQIPVLLAPGDTVLLHPQLLHSSEANQSLHSRRVLLNGFSYPGANHRNYPGRGSAQRINLLTGKTVDAASEQGQALAVSTSALTRVGLCAKATNQPEAGKDFGATFH